MKPFIQKNNDDGTVSLREPRTDAVLIEVTYHGRLPLDPKARRQAYDNQPDCVRRLQPFGRDGGVHIDGRGEINMVCDGNYGPSIVATVDELPELLGWLDRYFSDLGPDLYGGHWRTARGAYSIHCYSARDYTQVEIDKIREREHTWSSLDAHLNDPEPSIPRRDG